MVFLSHDSEKKRERRRNGLFAILSCFSFLCLRRREEATGHPSSPPYPPSPIIRTGPLARPSPFLLVRTDERGLLWRRRKGGGEGGWRQRRSRRLTPPPSPREREGGMGDRDSTPPLGRRDRSRGRPPARSLTPSERPPFPPRKVTTDEAVAFSLSLSLPPSSLEGRESLV